MSSKDSLAVSGSRTLGGYYAAQLELEDTHGAQQSGCGREVGSDRIQAGLGEFKADVTEGQGLCFPVSWK